MTDQEVRCAILKYACDEKKTGKVAMAVLDRIVGDYNLDNKRVLSILRSLEKEGLLKSVTRGVWVFATDYDITAEGIHEYQEKCSESKGD